MKFFNTAGPCDPRRHYMLAPARWLPGVPDLISRASYFVVHAPRQSGKTTFFKALAEDLTVHGRYTAVYATCEKGTARHDVERGVQAVLRDIEMEAASLPPELRPEPLEQVESIEPESRLGVYLEAWCRRSGRPVVLFLDEIDALLDETLLSVLRQLRAGYADRPERFPQSVVLIGLRNVRDYHTKAHDDVDGPGSASPFNILEESLTLRAFTVEEVGELYDQHTDETGQIFAPEAKALAWGLTRGQPWLVNALARQAVETVLPDRAKPVKARHMEQAKDVLIERRDSHLDSLIDRLREARVRRIIEPILKGQLVQPDPLDDDIRFAHDLGLITAGPTGLVIANPIYREVIPRALAWLTHEIDGS